jgi:NAD(P)H-dependent flavin oxidoreductase YrpB (nitropropane dioxygenase family)
MAAMMAAGAKGAWCGSVWLATPEAETSPTFRQKMIAARSRDTTRSKARTGKPARQLKTAWHEAWDGPASPGTLPMPLMGMVSEPSFAHVEKAVVNGNVQAQDLVSYFVGQGVGLVEAERSCRQVVQDFREEFAEAVLGLNAMLE